MEWILRFLIPALKLSNPPELLMVTAYGAQIPDINMEKAGITHILDKPLTPSALFDALAHLLLEIPRTGPAPRPIEIEEQMKLRKGAHILVVEDNIVNQEVICQLLESVGMIVSVVQQWPGGNRHG